jgi:starvation-inducible outer membrane lipoprotein
MSYRTTAATATFVLLCFLIGCASAPAPAAGQAHSEQQASATCVKTTGTNICRPTKNGNIDVVNSISADDLRRSGGPVTGARAHGIAD